MCPQYFLIGILNLDDIINWKIASL